MEVLIDRREGSVSLPPPICELAPPPCAAPAGRAAVNEGAMSADHAIAAAAVVSAAVVSASARARSPIHTTMSPFGLHPSLARLRSTSKLVLSACYNPGTYFDLDWIGS